MMAQTGRTQLGVRIPAGLHHALKDYSQHTGIPMVRLVADAIRVFLKERTGKEA